MPWPHLMSSTPPVRMFPVCRAVLPWGHVPPDGMASTVEVPLRPRIPSSFLLPPGRRSGLGVLASFVLHFVLGFLLLVRLQADFARVLEAGAQRPGLQGGGGGGAGRVAYITLPAPRATAPVVVAVTPPLHTPPPVPVIPTPTPPPTIPPPAPTEQPVATVVTPPAASVTDASRK